MSKKYTTDPVVAALLAERIADMSYDVDNSLGEGAKATNVRGAVDHVLCNLFDALEHYDGAPVDDPFADPLAFGKECVDAAIAQLTAYRARLEVLEQAMTGVWLREHDPNLRAVG